MFGFNMFPFPPRPFKVQFYCFSVAMIPGNERDDVERGGKIIMPPSSLEHLTRLSVNYPMLFKLLNAKNNRTTHCGVLEFVADEGKVYLPHWMMRNLMLEESDVIEIESVSLPVATFSRFQPQSPDFLDISNPKAVLENCLRNFACLTTGDVINIKYNQRDYELSVLETQPGNAVSIIECDMNVEFAPPLGYQEPHTSKETTEDSTEGSELISEISGFVPFLGEGHRLDGKQRKGETDGSNVKMPIARGIPDYEWKIGTLNFMRNVKQPVKEVVKEEDPFQPFSGEGHILSTNRKRK
uniref:Ubiquitin fusion degradation protein 1 homolog n=1 Tax=Riptortus pedestris TaxID=329032 RepID=R4WDU5_RIPPE|nr:ubiquitin fusion degradaton protein [Riptortus pedestris]